ncbi:transcription termination/antitermination protein NusG [Nonomuraea sp. NPDC059194]|uniref:transcription termination/antitermination protein NusG n=1 Tax=Nonomuraea sp. NPDC059194 TaxID=3346764 RepID=UPI0036941D56
MVEFQIGHRVVVTCGPFMTLEATIDELGETPTTAKGAIELFGRSVRVILSADTESSVNAVVDRSEVITRYAGATRFYNVVGRITSGARAGRYIRVDKLTDLAETPQDTATGVTIRIAADPGMEIDCIAEYVEDWAGVEETLLRDGHRVDWNGAHPDGIRQLEP